VPKVNHFVMTGTIRSVQIKGVDKPGRKPSAIFMLQYGKNRQRTGGAVEFVNAVLVRVPSSRLERIQSKLVDGAEVAITGHVQGLIKYTLGQAGYAIELVADHLEFDEPEDEQEDPEVAAVVAD